MAPQARSTAKAVSVLGRCRDPCLRTHCPTPAPHGCTRTSSVSTAVDLGRRNCSGGWAPTARARRAGRARLPPASMPAPARTDRLRNMGARGCEAPPVNEEGECNALTSASPKTEVGRGRKACLLLGRAGTGAVS